MRVVAVVASTALAIATAITVAPASAAEDEVLAVAIIQADVLERLHADDLAADLEEEGLELDAFEVSETEIDVEVSSSLGSGEEVITSVTLDVESATALVDVTLADGDGSSAEFVVEVQSFTSDHLRFRAIDAESGEEFVYDDSTGELAAIPLVLGIPISAVVLGALLRAAAVVVIAGVTYVAVTEAAKAIKQGSPFRHFVAVRQPAGLFIGKGLTLTEAIQRGRAGGDTWSTTKDGARAVARGVNNNTAVGPERSKGVGMVCHYHPSNRRPAMHAFYGLAVGAC